MKRKITKVILLGMLALNFMSCGGQQKTEENIASDSVSFNFEKEEDLIIKSGETRNLSCRIYQYNNVIIEEGATLKIADQSSRWFILWAKGDVIIKGKIVGINFRTGPRTIEDITPYGKKISHTYTNDVEGGTGGTGGRSVGGTPGTRSGGQGAVGTPTYGGGGGSGGGVYLAGDNSRLGGNGVSATDWRGAPLAQYGINNVGGNGAQINPYANGGLVFIYCGGTFKGEGGSIVLSGKRGDRGSDGGAGTESNRGFCGGGGGGGGAPGGEGGRLIVVSKEIESECRVDVNGGRGGQGGAAGIRPNGATRGSEGRDGTAGFVDWLTPEQWENEK